MTEEACAQPETGPYSETGVRVLLNSPSGTSSLSTTRLGVPRTAGPASASFAQRLLLLPMLPLRPLLPPLLMLPLQPPPPGPWVAGATGV